MSHRFRSFPPIVLIAVLATLTISAVAKGGVSDKEKKAAVKKSEKRYWKKWFAKNEFSFLLPSSFVEDESVRGEDSYVRSFASKDASVSIDFGRFSKPYDKEEPGFIDFKQRKIEIDGRAARLVTFVVDKKSESGSEMSYFAVIHFPKVGLSPVSVNRLTVVVASRSLDSRRMADQIFRSINFREN